MPASFTWDLSGDQDLMEGLEDVLYRPPVATGASVPDSTPIPNACRYTPTLREAGMSNGRYTSLNTIWTVKQSPFPSPGARVDGTLTDDQGAQYVIQEVGRGDAGGFYELITLQVGLETDLTETISVLRPTFTVDSAGRKRTESTETLYSAQPARVQPLSEIREEWNDKWVWVTTYRVYFEHADELTHEDQIVWDSRILEITQTANAERLDEIPYVDCVYRAD